MRIPNRGRGGGLKFNLTPMIDVVFNLIIFFLATSQLARSEQSEPVELPEAGTGRPEDPELRPRLTVTITPDLQFHVGKHVFDLPHLEELIQERSRASEKGELELRIRTDRHVPYRHIEPLLLACARAGVTKIKFAVLAKGENPLRGKTAIHGD